jgi:hypothetical protein
LIEQAGVLLDTGCPRKSKNIQTVAFKLLAGAGKELQDQLYCDDDHIFRVGKILSIVKQAFGTSGIPPLHRIRNSFLKCQLPSHYLLPPGKKTKTGFGVAEYELVFTQMFALKQSSD